MMLERVTLVHRRAQYNSGVTSWTWRKLLRRSRAPQQTSIQHPERAPEKTEREQDLLESVDLLERVAAGIALNKTPGR
jgi:hypothetical protein